VICLLVFWTILKLCFQELAVAANNTEGWLWKEDPTTRTWRRRYFVLKDNCLWYHEVGFKGSIPITTGIGVRAQPVTDPTLSDHDATFGGFASHSNFKFRFNISDNNRIYQVAADTEKACVFVFFLPFCFVTLMDRGIQVTRRVDRHAGESCQIQQSSRLRIVGRGSVRAHQQQ